MLPLFLKLAEVPLIFIFHEVLFRKENQKNQPACILPEIQQKYLSFVKQVFSN
jgi:hypothetical protein